MEAGSTAAPTPRTSSALANRVRLVLPLLLLALALSIFSATGSSLFGLIGDNPPAADQFDVRRVEFSAGKIEIKVTNPQREALSIASVRVDDSIVPFTLNGTAELGRLDSRTISVPLHWVDGDPYVIGITTGNGIETVHDVAAASATITAKPKGLLGFGLMGLLVGILPVGLGMLWLPSLRHARPEWLVGFMALTAGLLTFLAVEALFESLDAQASLPAAFGGVGVVVLGLTLSFLGLSYVSTRFSSAGGKTGEPLTGVALATVIAIGIGLHNLGEGLAIGSSFAIGELTLGTLLVIGFTVHNITEGLGIVAPMAEGVKPSIGRLVALAAIAGLPAVPGTWIGGYLTSDFLVALFFAIAAGAALQVIVEVLRFVRNRDPIGLRSPIAAIGFASGVAVMYLTGLIAG